jgi:polyhydroxyalkanoate synthase
MLTKQELDRHLDPESWKAAASRSEGSWWPAWEAWLQARSGAPVPAPAQIGSEKLPAICDAPGTYVLAP